MKAKTSRNLLRILHLAVGATVAAVVYLPPDWVEPLRWVLGFVVVPLLVLSGLTLWFQGQIRRWLGGRRRTEAGRPAPVVRS